MSWLDKYNPIKNYAEIKSLQKRLDSVMEDKALDEDYSAKYLDTDSSGYGTGGYLDYPGIEQQVDAQTLQKIYSNETWVYGAVTTIAESIASLPLKLEKAKKINKTVVNEQTGLEEKITEVIWTDASGDKLFEAFEYPNRYTTKTEFLMLMVIDLLTVGEYFIYLDAADGVDLGVIEGDASDDSIDSPFGRLRALINADSKPVKGMYRIPPVMMKPVPSKDRRKVEGYMMQNESGMFAFQAAEIIHVKLPNPLDQFRGLSPLIAAFKPVLMDRFTTEHMIRFYKSGARLGGVIETEKSLNPSQMARFQRSFESNYTGRQNHHRTLVLPPGMSYEAIEQNPAETALLEFCKYNREAILSVYKLPPIKLGIMDGATYANANIQNKTYYNDCIKPKLSFIEDGFNKKSALTPSDKHLRIKFDLSGVEELTEDLAMLAASAKSMLDSGLTVNEVRKKIYKLGPLQGGNKAPAIENMSKPTAPSFFGASMPQNNEVKAIEGESVKPTDMKPTGGTYVDRVNELVGQMVQAGTPLHLAIPKAMEQARLEGFTDESVKQEEQKLGIVENAALIPTMIGPKCPKCDREPCECPDKHLPKAESEEKESLAPINSSEEIQSEAQTQEVVIDTAQRFGVKKEAAAEQWKSFISVTAPLVNERLVEVQKFFKKFEARVLNRFGTNIKSFGVFKARNSDDIDDILNLKEYEDIIDGYIKQIDEALLDAYKYGFADTLSTFNFNPANEDAIKYLKQYGANSVSYVTETTKEQLKTLLTDAFEAELPVGEIAKQIKEKFSEMRAGRAETIARTETLSAVSAGREAKRVEWQQQFPEAKLKKQWVTSQDDRVRDAHQEMEGEVVDADAEFSNGLRYPRDAKGSPEQVINCRCADISFVAEDQTLIQDTLVQEDTQD